MAVDREHLVFDLYGTLVDPLAIAVELERVLPTDLARLVAGVWRQKQLEYAFRLTVMQRYRDFEWVTARALDHALLVGDATLTPVARQAVLAAYDAPTPFPDVGEGLRVLAAAGYSLSILSNGNSAMLDRCLRAGGLAEHFSTVLSVDAVAAFKPAPQVYRYAAETLGRPLGELRLISSNPFDVIGAEAVGMQTAWINRSGGPFDTIGDPPDTVCATVLELAALLDRQ